MKKNRYILGILIILFSCISVLTSISQEKELQKPISEREEKKRKVEEKNVIDGYAEEFSQNEKEGIIILEENVKIYRHDGFMYADKVTIYRDVNTTPREVVKTVAEGNVHLKDKEILADCDKAVFNEVDNTIELTGSVVVIQNEDRIEASYIKYNRETGERIGKGTPDNPIKFRVKIKTEEEEATKEAESNESKSESEKQK